MNTIIINAAYTLAFAAYFNVCAVKSTEIAPKNTDYPAATGIMLPEVVISSMPTYTLREVVVSTKATVEINLPEVVILANTRP